MTLKLVKNELSHGALLSHDEHTKVGWGWEWRWGRERSRGQDRDQLRE